MNKRERILAIAAAVCLIGWFGLPTVNRLLCGRVSDRQDRLT